MLLFLCDIKAIVHPELLMLFHELLSENVGNKQLTVAIDSHSIHSHAVEVNGCRQRKGE